MIRGTTPPSGSVSGGKGRMQPSCFTELRTRPTSPGWRQGELAPSTTMTAGSTKGIWQPESNGAVPAKALQ